jgi:transposase
LQAVLPHLAEVVVESVQQGVDVLVLRARWRRRTARCRGADAVVAGLSSTWNSGQVEGQVTKGKLLKRAGYGRAELDLLRTRIRLRT